MNGRIYDPTIGRFLQADPIIQDPYDTQSLNRYSYVMNNPLSYTDPTGYSRLRSGWWRAPLSIAAAFIPIPGINKLIAKAAIKGALSGAIATGNLKGAVRGAIQAAVTSFIGHGLDGKGGIKNDFARGFAHAVVGGVSAELDGGKFGHGFASSAVAKPLLYVFYIKYINRTRVFSLVIISTRCNDSGITKQRNIPTEEISLRTI